MNRLIVTRVASLIPTLLVVAVLIFLMIRLVPGDVVDAMLDGAQDEHVEQEIRRALGLDVPVHEQFVAWFGGLVRGDLGTSFVTRRPVATEILARLPATLELSIAAVLVSLVIAIPAGVLSATRRGRPIDVVARVLSLIGLAIPNFWLGLLLIIVFAVWLRQLPSAGYAPWTTGLQEHLRYMVLPVVTLGTALAAITMRMTRSALLEVLQDDYIRTARAKGLGERRVTYGHALRNSLIPVVTILGIQIGRLLGGAVVVETVFTYPGMGLLAIRAIQTRDYPVVQGVVLCFATFFVLSNLIADFAYAYLDPRLRNA